MHILNINFTKSVWLSLDVSKSTDRMANSVDPDQTAPVGAVWSGSTLFAQTYLFEYLAYNFIQLKQVKIANFHQEN